MFFSLSVVEKVEKEEFLACCQRAEKYIDSVRMPRSVRTRVSSSTACSSTVSGRYCWMRAKKSGLSWCSISLLYLQHLLLLHKGCLEDICAEYLWSLCPCLVPFSTSDGVSLPEAPEVHCQLCEEVFHFIFFKFMLY